MGVSAVLTAYCTDIAGIFSHLYDEVGARNIYMKPVNAPHDADHALNQHTLAAFQAGYLGLVEHILNRSPGEILNRLLALNPEDFFMRFFYRIKDRTIQTYRCGAGKSGAYVDTNGRLYACAHFIGKSGWDIGHIDTGFDEDRRRKFASLTVDTREPCRSCFARYVCGGGCYYQAVLANGDISRPDEVKCELIRFLTRLAIRLVETLRIEHPQVLAALSTPYGLDHALAGAPADTVYRPLGRLRQTSAPAPLALHAPGRVRRGLPLTHDLLLRCSICDRRLTIELSGPAVGAGCDQRDSVDAVRIWMQPWGDGQFTLADLQVRTGWNSGRLLRVTADGAAWLDTPDERYRRVPHPQPRWLATPDTRVERDIGVIRVRIDLGTLPTTTSALGINVFADLASGGEVALARHEPFVGIPLDADGPLELVGPDAAGDTDWPEELVPLGRWTGLHANVC
jgi:radical SAM protein with 4Fe4S-binding SPASM domain